MQNDYQKAMSFRAKRRRVVERSEKSRVHKVGVTEILRYAQDDKMIGNFYYDTPSLGLYQQVKERWEAKKTPATGCVPITGAKVGRIEMRSE